MLNEIVIGDIYLKHIDQETRTCEMGMHITNDQCKAKGYGAQALQLVYQYAFATLNMEVVYADVLIKKQEKHLCIEKGRIHRK